MDQQQPSCATCGTTVQLMRCATCKTAYYCSVNHQHIDWPNHKQECRQLAKRKNNNKQLQQSAAQATALNNTSLLSSSLPSPSSSSSSASMVVAPPEILSTDYLTNGSEFEIDIEIASGILSNINSQPLSVILGQNENEIFSSEEAGILTPLNSNGSMTEFLDDVETSPTSMEQMYNCGNVLQEQHQQPQQQQMPMQLTQEDFLLQQQQQQYPSRILQAPPPQQIPQQQIQNQNRQQFLQYQQNNQNYNFNNSTINQSEKSSSYQISQGDENAIGIANELRYDDLCRNIINDMNQYGLSVVDDFLGMEKGLQILNEVHRMYAAGVFQNGQVVTNLIAEQDLRTIRGDKITWVKGVEPGCANVGYLINQIDAVICRANTMRDNGKLGNYNIRERTKAMVACYPGSGAHYVMHVDNPNRDGRVITAIYYLNVNWDTKRSGGVLRIFPEHGGSVADIEPKFDRLIFFWSDKRNPHEVQPAHRTRYAITVWYFDANEREAALNRWRQDKNTSNISNTKTPAAAAARTKTTANVNSNTTTNTSEICT